MVNDTTSHEQAAVLLTNLWATSNQAKKVLLQAQVDADELEAEAVHQQEDEARVLREAEALKDKDDLCKEECKKNQAKFLLIPDQPRMFHRGPLSSLPNLPLDRWTRAIASPYGTTPTKDSKMPL